MLRYYEQIGLIESLRKENYSYRVYDEKAFIRLQQIIILRKLRVPIKQICHVLNNQDVITAIDVFKMNIDELNDEINALSTIRTILNRLVNVLQEKISVHRKLDLFDDESVLMLIKSLSLSKNYIKEEKSMDDLYQANERLSKLEDVRIIYLPPMTVASSHYIGEDSEMHSGTVLDKFVKESGLLKIKPDTRHFGFNNPIQQADYGTSSSGYEMWVSIPENMKVPTPLKKLQFHGGLYAAHVITFGNFDHWGMLADWVMNNDKYASDWGSLRCTPHVEGMDWAMEEQLNYLINIQNPNFDINNMQLDLLFPIKEK
jgi:DNA-binding transcriptional MerR regulator